MYKLGLKEVSTLISNDFPIKVYVHNESFEVGKNDFFISENFGNEIIVKSKFSCSTEYDPSKLPLQNIARLKISNHTNTLEETMEMNVLNEKIYFEKTIEVSEEFMQLIFEVESDYPIFFDIDFLEVGVI